MKLRLEKFEDISILHISQELTSKDVDILRIGIPKLDRPELQCLVLDALSVVGTTQVLRELSEMRRGLKAPTKLLLVHSDPDSSDVGSLEAAIQRSGSKDAADLHIRVRLEREFSSLVEQREKIERQLSEIRGPGESLDTTNRVLKVKRELLQSVLKSWEKMAQAVPEYPASPEQWSECRRLENEMMERLNKQGVV